MREIPKTSKTIGHLLRLPPEPKAGQVFFQLSQSTHFADTGVKGPQDGGASRITVQVKKSCLQVDGQIRRSNRIDVNSLERDNAARRFVLVLRRDEVVQDGVVEDEPVFLPLPDIP